jgi:hypothetical protein
LAIEARKGAKMGFGTPFLLLFLQIINSVMAYGKAKLQEFLLTPPQGASG